MPRALPVPVSAVVRRSELTAVYVLGEDGAPRLRQNPGRHWGLWRPAPAWDLELVYGWFRPGAAFEDASDAFIGKLQVRFRY